MLNYTSKEMINMNYKITKSNIEKLLKKDIPALEKQVDAVDVLLKKTTNNDTIYKLLMYKRALQIIIVSKAQNQDVDLEEINELMRNSTLFSLHNARRDDECTGPRKR